MGIGHGNVLGFFEDCNFVFLLFILVPDSRSSPSGLFGAAGPGSGLGETNSAELAGSLSMNTLQV